MWWVVPQAWRAVPLALAVFVVASPNQLGAPEVLPLLVLPELFPTATVRRAASVMSLCYGAGVWCGFGRLAFNCIADVSIEVLALVVVGGCLPLHTHRVVVSRVQAMFVLGFVGVLASPVGPDAYRVHFAMQSIVVSGALLHSAKQGGDLLTWLRARAPMVVCFSCLIFGLHGSTVEEVHTLEYQWPEASLLDPTFLVLHILKSTMMGTLMIVYDGIATDLALLDVSHALVALITAEVACRRLVSALACGGVDVLPVVLDMSLGACFARVCSGS